MKILRNESLAKYTTFKIGGPADYFVKAKREEELVEAVREAKKKKLPFFILGGGSNILVGDKGFWGMVIKNEMNKIRIVGYKGEVKSPRTRTNSVRGRHQAKVKSVYLKADSGVLVNRLVRYTLDQGFSGLENFLGQPGTVGGAIYMNAHNMKENDFFGKHLLEAQLLTSEGEIKRVEQEYFQFGYDKSKIQETGEIVLLCVIGVKRDKRGKYKLWQKADKVIEHRQKTQPYGVGSSGCVFRNISKAEALRIGTPNYTCSAGFLLEACGLKGKQIGGAKFSEKHANFIVNVADARASDVIKLIELAKIRVRERFGVELEEEIIRVGNF